MIHKTSLESHTKMARVRANLTQPQPNKGVWDEKWEGSGFKISIYFSTCIDHSVAQWIRHWSMKLETLSSIPSRVSSLRVQFMIHKTSLESHTKMAMYKNLGQSHNHKECIRQKSIPSRVGSSHSNHPTQKWQMSHNHKECIRQKSIPSTVGSSHSNP